MLRIKLNQILRHQLGPASCRLTNNSSVPQRTIMTAIKTEQEPGNLRSQWAKPTFNINKMMELLDHDNHQMRKELREFLSDPVFKPRYNIPLEEEREV